MKNKWTIFGAVTGAALIVFIFFGVAYAKEISLKIPAEISADVCEQTNLEDSQLKGYDQLILSQPATALNAATSTATSTAINIGNAKKVTLAFTRPTNGAGGSSVFSVWASVDGENYFLYNKLIDNTTNSNSQNLTRVASKTLTGTTTEPVMVSMDLEHDALKDIKVIVNEETDGSHTAVVVQQQ